MMQILLQARLLPFVGKLYEFGIATNSLSTRDKIRRRALAAARWSWARGPEESQGVRSCSLSPDPASREARSTATQLSSPSVASPLSSSKEQCVSWWPRAAYRRRRPSASRTVSRRPRRLPPTPRGRSSLIHARRPSPTPRGAGRCSSSRIAISWLGAASAERDPRQTHTHVAAIRERRPHRAPLEGLGEGSPAAVAWRLSRWLWAGKPEASREPLACALFLCYGRSHFAVIIRTNSS